VFVYRFDATLDVARDDMRVVRSPMSLSCLTPKTPHPRLFIYTCLQLHDI
jgi:hypothetical protein